MKYNYASEVECNLYDVLTNYKQGNVFYLPEPPINKNINPGSRFIFSTSLVPVLDSVIGDTHAN